QIIRPTTSNPTILSAATSNATTSTLPIIPISPRIQGATVQSQTQQIQIASLAAKPTTVMSSQALPISLPMGSNQHQKIFTTTRQTPIYARKPTEEELDQILSNRNQQRATNTSGGVSSNVSTISTQVVQMQPNTVVSQQN